jgi:hypothetical protein
MIIFIQSNFTRVEISFSVNNIQLMKLQDDKKIIDFYWKSLKTLSKFSALLGMKNVTNKLKIKNGEHVIIDGNLFKNHTIVDMIKNKHFPKAHYK